MFDLSSSKMIVYSQPVPVPVPECEVWTLWTYHNRAVLNLGVSTCLSQANGPSETSEDIAAGVVYTGQGSS
jgi:hypothetical protein